MGWRRRTDGDLPDKVVKSVPAKHLSKHLLGILKPASGLSHATTVLLAKLVVFVSQLGVGQNLVSYRDLLELETTVRVPSNSYWV